MNYRELKQELEKFTDLELDQEIMLEVGGMIVTTVTGFWKSDDDLVIDDEYLTPENIYKQNLMEENSDDPNYQLDEYKIWIKKGQQIIQTDTLNLK